MVGFGAPNEPPNVFWSVMHRVTRATGLDQVGKKGGGVPPTVAWLARAKGVLVVVSHF